MTTDNLEGEYNRRTIFLVLPHNGYKYIPFVINQPVKIPINFRDSSKKGENRLNSNYLLLRINTTKTLFFTLLDPFVLFNPHKNSEKIYDCGFHRYPP